MVTYTGGDTSRIFRRPRSGLRCFPISHPHKDHGRNSYQNFKYWENVLKDSDVFSRYADARFCKLLQIFALLFLSSVALTISIIPEYLLKLESIYICIYIHCKSCFMGDNFNKVVKILCVSF